MNRNLQISDAEKFQILIVHKIKWTMF